MEGESFLGLGVVPGIAFGRVALVDRRRVAVPRYHLRPNKVEAELDRFEKAIVASEVQLLELGARASASGLSEVQNLLDAHGMILRDQFLHQATRQRITDERINAEWALSKVVRKIREIFDNLEEGFFRERRGDVELVGDRVMRNLIGVDMELFRNLPPDAVVVAYDLPPADCLALPRYSLKGFVTETGGRTSHIAIFARSMNIPTVLGVRGIVERAGSGDRIVVDGTSGQVLLRPTAAVQTRLRAEERRRAKEEAALLADRHLPAETTDGVTITLLGNIEVPDEVSQVLAQGGQGIGLYRTEFLVIERGRMPSATEHAAEYRQVVQGMQGKPVTIRTIDIGGDKFMRSRESGSNTPQRANSQNERNSALGLRAIRYSLRDLDSFKAQLRGILLASAEGPTRVLIPLVTNLEEVRQTRAILESVKEELSAEGLPFDPKILLGVMIETPAAVFLAPDFAREVDFFSIGTNDLIQYALAIDRRDDDVAYLYQPSAPSVIRMLRMVADAASVRGLPLSVCGEMAADPFHVPLLIGLGIRQLSMSPHSIPLVKRLIRRVSFARCREMVQRGLSCTTAADVESALSAYLEELA